MHELLLCYWLLLCSTCHELLLLLLLCHWLCYWLLHCLLDGLWWLLWLKYMCVPSLYASLAYCILQYLHLQLPAVLVYVAVKLYLFL